MDTTNTATPLTQKPIPTILEEQLALFTRDAMHATEVGQFNPAATSQALTEKAGQQLVAVDMGGDKIVANLFEVQNGTLQKLPGLDLALKSHHGEGYLEILEQAAAYAREHSIPVGVSYAGLMEGSKPVGGPNVTTFRNELSERYNGDFAQLFPTLAAAQNDAIAGLIAGSVEAYKQNPHIQNVVYVINGSGIGGAVLKEDTMFTAEGGHIQIADRLNIFNQQKKCGVFSPDYTCMERVGANKAGVEDQWYQRTQEKLSGREIEDRYKAGDQFAGELYDHSALILAHVIQGIASAFSIEIGTDSTAIVGHGGAFRFPEYGNRIQQILAQRINATPTLILAEDFSDNSCLEGAAFAALAKSI